MAGRRLTIVASVLLLSGTADAAAQPQPLIAYESEGLIKVIRPDGTERRLLTRPSSRTDALAPAWSPSGNAIGFVRSTDPGDQSDRREVSRLVLLDLATGASRIVAHDAGSGGLAFSPDGGSIVYAASVQLDGEEFTEALRVVTADGSAGRSLTRPSGAGADYWPAWSPDGSTIAFTRATASEQGDGDVAIWTVPAAGGEPRRLVPDAEDPAWSPDGRLLAFATTRDENGTTCFHECSPNREIYVAGANGSGARRLTFTKTDEGSPAWSPDGRQIAFHSSRPRPEGNAELFAMQADGTCPTQLTNTSVANLSPDWRPGAPYAAPLSCDGAVPGAAMQSFETDVSAASGFRRFPLAWLGQSHNGLMLSALALGEFVTLIYHDCGLVGRSCEIEELQVQTASICRRHPLRYGGYLGPGEPDHSPHVTRYRRVGNALLAAHGSGPEVYTGRITATLFGASFEQAAAIAAQLTLFQGSRSALAAPRFSSRVLARLRSVRRELRRLGMRELSRRWRMSPDQIRAAVKLRAVLRPAELRRGTSRC